MKTKIILLHLMAILMVINLHGQSVGEAAPDFTVTTLDGETFKLSDEQGKLVVIYFFGNSCPFCIGSAPNVESDIHQEYMDNENFEIIGLDTWDGSSTSTSVTSFRENTGVTFPLVVKGGNVATEYGSTYDRLLVVDADGILRHKGSTDVSGDLDNAISAIEMYLSTDAPTSNPEIKNEEIPIQLLQGQNNQFTLKFIAEKKGTVTVDLYDITGKKITLYDAKPVVAGENPIRFNLSHMSKGMYIYQLDANGSVNTGKLIVK